MPHEIKPRETTNTGEKMRRTQENDTHEKTERKRRKTAETEIERMHLDEKRQQHKIMAWTCRAAASNQFIPLCLSPLCGIITFLYESSIVGSYFSTKIPCTNWTVWKRRQSTSTSDQCDLKATRTKLSGRFVPLSMPFYHNSAGQWWKLCSCCHPDQPGWRPKFS